MDPLDYEFRRRWSACLEWIGRRLLAPVHGGDQVEDRKADKSRGQNKAPTGTRP
jgi:hypothetical protein